MLPYSYGSLRLSSKQSVYYINLDVSCYECCEMLSFVVLGIVNMESSVLGYLNRQETFGSGDVERFIDWDISAFLYTFYSISSKRSPWSNVLCLESLFMTT